MSQTHWVSRHRRRGALFTVAGIALFTAGLSVPGAATPSAPAPPAVGGAAAPAGTSAAAAPGASPRPAELTPAPGWPGGTGASGVAGRAVAWPSARRFAPCPEAFPVAELAAGMVATGLTVERGTVPERFTATVIGMVTDGVAPGIDMVIVDTASPAVERAGGVWQGMSGSPVYAPDGRLIGAIAYSLGIPSSIAGVTPAADMQALLDRPSEADAGMSTTSPERADATPDAASQLATRVELPAALQRRVAATGAATAAEAAAGLRPLPVPLGVSGIHPAHLDEAADRLAASLPGARVHAAGAAPVDRPGSAAGIVPGGNFATAISYGEVTVSGVGTTTAVCPAAVTGGQQALAFGHPLGWLGATTLSVHPASAVYVQPDPVLGPFKTANLGGVVGTLDQDRLVGIRGLLGPTPSTSEVRSTVTAADDGTTRSGTTRVNVQTFLPGIAADHLMGALDRTADRVGGGSSEVRWVVSGTRGGGAPFALGVTNLYTDRADISQASAGDLVGQLALLDTNRFEDVRITGVELTGSVSSAFTQYTLDAVLVGQPDGTYAPPPAGGLPLPVVAGEPLALRLVLEPYRGDGEVRQVDLALDVPAEAAGTVGLVRVAGGLAGALPPAEPDSFDDLLAQLEGMVTNNAVTATLTLEGQPPTAATSTARTTVDKVVTGEHSLLVQILPAPAP